MPKQQTLSPVVEAEIIENVLEITQWFHERCLELARLGHGFDITVHGKGRAKLKKSYTVHENEVVVM